MTAIRTINDSTGTRLLLSALIGLVAGLFFYNLGLHQVSILIGWDAAIITFVLWLALIILPLSPQETARFALREDPSSLGSNLILILASFASIGAVGAALYEAHHNPNVTHSLLLTGICIGSVILSWLLIHTIFTLHYARMYYTEHIAGSFDFNGGDSFKPTYTDFAYIAFTVGMTYQIADTSVSGTALRRTVLRHALLSFVFGTVIVATTVSVIAGLGN